jgi:hypothetical protein
MFEPELDIVIWVPRADRSSEVSRLSKRLFDAAAERGLHLALFTYPARLLREAWPHVVFDTESVACLRSCLMKPEHLDWGDRLWELLQDAMYSISK